MTTKAQQILDFALLQGAAECYLDGINFGESEKVEERLSWGNNDLRNEYMASLPFNELPGATRLTDTQAQWFIDNYEIVTHYPNDASGFSATLFKNKNTGEYTLSFRSTEYQFQNKGGDYERDGSAAADGDIVTYGFALGQLSSMEDFYAHLKQGETWDAATEKWVANPAVAAFAAGTHALNVTGYSLGAHMASAFTLMHEADVKQTYTFNAAGLGGISLPGNENYYPNGSQIKLLIDAYNALMNFKGGDNTGIPLWNELVKDSQNLGLYIGTVESIQGQTYTNLYDNPLHKVVMTLLDPRMYPVGSGLHFLSLYDSMGDARLLDSISNFDPTNLNSFTSDLFEVPQGAWSKIHQFYGHGEFLDMEFVANSGWHVSPTMVFIEDLPLSRGLGLIELAVPEYRGLVGEFGETHSITPIIDSLTCCTARKATTACSAAPAATTSPSLRATTSTWATALWPSSMPVSLTLPRTTCSPVSRPPSMPMASCTTPTNSRTTSAGL